MISYAPLWLTLKKKKISSYQLIHRYGYSKNTIHRLRHNKAITTRTIEDFCRLLDCRVGDILEFVPDPTSTHSN